MNFYPFAVTSTLIASQEASSQQGQVMKLHVTVNGAPRVATLYDNATSRDLLKLLPLELTLQDYASAEKIAYPRFTSVQGERAMKLSYVLLKG